MEEKKEIPSTMELAGWMALPIGLMWSASFLCTMYGTTQPLLSMLGTVLGVGSIFVLRRQLTNYRKLHPEAIWLQIFRLAFVTCLLAGLLTDAVQYAYFMLLDNGRLLSQLGTAFQSEEYREVWQKMMPEANLDEMQKLVQSMTVRDIMLQLVFYNIILALPVSLLASIMIPHPPIKGEPNNKS
jgi:hypothetical protein